MYVDKLDVAALAMAGLLLGAITGAILMRDNLYVTKHQVDWAIEVCEPHGGLERIYTDEDKYLCKDGARIEVQMPEVK